MTNGPTKRRTTAALSLLGLLFQRMGGVLGVAPDKLALAMSAAGLMAASSGLTYWVVAGRHAPAQLASEDSEPELDLAPPSGSPRKKLRPSSGQLASQTGVHAGGSLQATRGWGPVRKAGAGPGDIFKKRPKEEEAELEVRRPERRKTGQESQPILPMAPFVKMDDGKKPAAYAPRDGGYRSSPDLNDSRSVAEARDRPLIPEVDYGRAVDAAPGLARGKPDLAPGYSHEDPEKAPGGAPARMTGAKGEDALAIGLDPEKAYLHEDAARVGR